jgi:hypothetical protein
MQIFIRQTSVLKISDTIINNEYIGNCRDTVFTMMVRDSIQQHLTSQKFKDLNYVQGLLQYPPRWKPDTDIFSYISKDSLKRIQNKTCFFIFDASTEGFSPVNDFPFFDMLYYNCEKYTIDPAMIIYVSSNLKDEENIKKYCQANNKSPINVFSFISFEKVARSLLNLETEQIKCQEDYQGKYLSSLSRVNRHYRSLATFLLYHSNIRDKSLISHDAFSKNVNIASWKAQAGLAEYSITDVENWFSALPLTVDKADFNTNWALDNDYYNIHRKTLFQIVNETLVDNYNNTSVFYSEKTFRPIVCFQPFVIYGQKGCNRHLKEIGYKTYDDWFDLSFDEEEDNVVRYKKLLISVSDTCKYLDSLDKEKQLEWRFKNKKTLRHNFLTMTVSQYSKDKLHVFLKGLDDRVNN